jgi:hypothetical protein
MGKEALHGAALMRVSVRLEYVQDGRQWLHPHINAMELLLFQGRSRSQKSFSESSTTTFCVMCRTSRAGERLRHKRYEFSCPSSPPSYPDGRDQLP